MADGKRSSSDGNVTVPVVPRVSQQLEMPRKSTGSTSMNRRERVLMSQMISIVIDVKVVTNTVF